MSGVTRIDGLKVKDAKKSVAIHISAADIRRGKVKDPTSCAAAVCCKRELGAVDARVHVTRTYLRFNGKWERFLTSPALRTEIVTFDRGGKFEPGEYALYRVQPSRKGDTSRDTGQRRRRYKKRRLGVRHILSGVRPMGLAV